jgi:hypothetical protein
MKRKAIGCMAGILIAISPLVIHGQTPPLPNGGNDPSGVNSPVGGGASLGGGLIPMLAMAAFYGSRKIYNSRKRILD